MFCLSTTRNGLVRFYRWLGSLNFYTSNSTDEHEIRTGLVATRISALLLIGSLISLTLYSGLVDTNQIVTVVKPNFDRYQFLVNHHSDLTCTCTNIDILYSSFVKLQPHYHQLCTSDFVGATWMTFIVTLDNGDSVGFTDWRRMSFAQFQLIVALCDLAETTINDAVDVFSETRLIVFQLAAESNFLSQVKVITESFQTNTQNTFERALNMISVMKQGNLLVSGLGTNYYYQAEYYDNWYSIPVYASSRYFVADNNAWYACHVTSKFTNIAVAQDNEGVGHLIPGWRYGCYVEDALFASTLECYYNITCVSLLRMIYAIPFDVQTLQILNDSRFDVTTTIGSIVRQLFVEDWEPTFNFTGYFTACSPSICTYTVVERRSFFIVLTTLVGLLGGLTKAIDLTVPRGVRFVRGYGRQWNRTLMVKWREKRGTTITPVEQY